MKILAQTTIGNLQLKNKMVMAPMTRSRTEPSGVVPEITAEYYAQRASAGLIISEAINISEQAIGLPLTPGIYTPPQIQAWKRVTEKVHEAGGKIFAQLQHTGRAGHSLNRNGIIPVAPSAIPITGLEVFTNEGMKPYETPRELSTEEVKAVILDYKKAALNAMEAGFDGVEIQAGFGFLPNQFLAQSSNIRTDSYGGSIADRSRFLLELTTGVIAAVGPHRVGVKLSPGSKYHSIEDSETIALYSYLIAALNEMPIAYFHLMQPLFPNDGLPHESSDVLDVFGGMIKKHIIINGGYDRQTAETEIENDRAQLVSFGKLFLANPDLPKRFALNASLNVIDTSSMYGGGQSGYTDYPFLPDQS